MLKAKWIEKRKYLPIALATALSGCLNPAAVREYAAIANAAAEEFPGVAAITYDACVERNSFEQLATKDQPDQQAIQDECADSKATEESLLLAHNVLEDYLRSLALLASDNLVTFDEETKAAVDQVGSLAQLNADQKKAVTGLTQLLFKAFTDGYRRGKLTHVIGEANPHIRSVTEALKEILEEDLDQKLNGLESEIESYYRTGIASARAHDPNAEESLQVRSWKLRLVEEKARVAASREATTAYVKILEDIAEGHEELNKRRSALGSKETLQALFSYASNIRKNLKAVQKAFTTK